MGASSFHDLVQHVGHDVVVVFYGPPENPQNAAVECLTCSEVLLDFDNDGGDAPAAAPQEVSMGSLACPWCDAARGSPLDPSEEEWPEGVEPGWGEDATCANKCEECGAVYSFGTRLVVDGRPRIHTQGREDLKREDVAVEEVADVDA
jgi:hypothetical protein